MTKELSALLDGELESHEVARLFAVVKSDERLLETWSDYQVIAAAIRREEPLVADLATRVMSSLEQEPTVLAPRRARDAGWHNSVLALAASVAGVAVVGWLALGQQPPVSAPMAMVASVQSGPVVTTASASDDASEYRQYLLAHQASAPGLHMQSGAQHVRTVSAMGPGQ